MTEKHVMFADLPVKCVTRKESKKQRKPAKKNKDNYPDCTKEALLRAFENANLPDYDEILKHELHVTKIKASEVDAPPKKPSPPLHKLMEPFHDLIDWSRVDLNSDYPFVSPSKRRRKSVDNSASDSVIFQDVENNTDELNQSETNEHYTVGQIEQSMESFVENSFRVPLQSLGNKVSVPLNNPKVSVVSACDSVSKGIATSTPIQVNRKDKTLHNLSRIALTQIELSQNNSCSDNSEGDSFKSWNIVNRLGSSLFKPQHIPSFSKKQRSFSVCVEKPEVQCFTAAEPQLRKSNRRKSSFSGKTFRRRSVAYEPNFGSLMTTNRSVLPFEKIPFSVLAEALNTEEDLRSLVNSSFAAAFSSSKCVFVDGEEKTFTAKEKVLLLCTPSVVISFKDLLSEVNLTTYRKIGEGSYGEVFECSTADGSNVVIKVIAMPMSGLCEENVYDQILPELMISNSLSAFCNGNNNRAFNFINMKHAACVKGRFPAPLLREWQRFQQQVGTENINPAQFTSNQLYIVMFLANGGEDLESHEFYSAVEALSVFQQITCSLAAAECEYEFEHRDLHWGNILIASTNDRQLHYVIKKNCVNVDTNGVLVSIIDFSLSRMCKDDVIVFDDLSKYNDLFQGKGDYQFNIYRKMRKENNNDWQRFSPHTNILWLHYILKKLCECKKYRSKSQAHVKALNTLKDIAKSIVKHKSAHEFVLASQLFVKMCDTENRPLRNRRI
ncbi:uncharacterized protein B4U80_08937 [Leptotrombidium deliense]|uniref:non-specific serine/threonine protein kinase n=1 Tax=Leptotrombidium deliense TaxID=299467 RepID=A0A443SDW0_9ACAR|nr:uncharacterized protein B4U80_08937 [Leptotrombidium deliense]